MHSLRKKNKYGNKIATSKLCLCSSSSQSYVERSPIYDMTNLKLVRNGFYYVLVQKCIRSI